MRNIFKWLWWTMLGASAIIRLVGTPADVKAADDSLSWWLQAWNWALANDVFWWVILVLLAVAMFALQVSPKLPTWLASFWHNKELYSKLIQEHDDMGRGRRKYWTIMKDIYNDWGIDDESYGSTLETLIASAEIPVLDTKKPNVEEWVNGLTGASASLWKHIAWVNRSDKQRDINRREELKDIQRDISNYWNKTAAAIYDEKEISQKKVFERHFPHQSKLLKMILYMECFQMLEFDSERLRKPFAFKLYQEAKKTGQTDEWN